MRRLALLLTLLVVGCPPPSDPTQLPNLNRPAAVTSQSVAQIESGVAVVVIIDTSGSMEGDKLSTVKNITVNDISPKMGLFSLANKLEVCVISCGGGASVVLPMGTFEAPKFEATINRLSSGGGTPLAESLTQGFAQLAASRLEKRHLFVLSDGQGNNSVEPILNSMKQNGLDTVELHVIGFQSDETYYEPFKNVGSAVLMAENHDTLEQSMSFTFEGILKVEAE